MNLSTTIKSIQDIMRHDDGVDGDAQRSAGNAGEFYTPRAVTEFMVDRVNPRLDARETVLEPACGTGGFLTASIAHLDRQLSERSGPNDKRAIAACIRGM